MAKMKGSTKSKKSRGCSFSPISPLPLARGEDKGGVGTDTCHFARTDPSPLPYEGRGVPSTHAAHFHLPGRQLTIDQHYGITLVPMVFVASYKRPVHGCLPRALPSACA